MNAITRLLLAIQIYSLDIHIDALTKRIHVETDPVTTFSALEKRRVAKDKRAALRSRYNATLPPGQVRTWRAA